MRPLLFCAWCGGALEQRGDEGAHCRACDRTWYRNPAPTVGAVIVLDGRALVTERAFEPFKGRFDVPGGFLRRGEDPLDGLRREVKEELGVDIDVGIDDLIGLAPHRYGDGDDWNLSLGFTARLVAGEPQPADDVAAIRWVGPGELDGLQWAWEHDRELVRTALHEGGPRHG